MTPKKILSSLALIVCGLFALTPSLAADPADKQVMVELFSSQNCGNCPKANENLIALAEDPNVFPLVWSVSYWEYTGVKEPYATPEVQARQRRYADHFQLRGPYTPQVVIDGCRQSSGLRTESMSANLEHASKERSPPVSLSVSPKNVMLKSDEVLNPTNVWLVGYIPGITELTPEKGKNSGKTLRHAHMATSLHKIGNWDGIEPAWFDFECRSLACVVIVQESESGEILDFSVVPAVSG